MPVAKLVCAFPCKLPLGKFKGVVIARFCYSRKVLKIPPELSGYNFPRGEGGTSSPLEERKRPASRCHVSVGENLYFQVYIFYRERAKLAKKFLKIVTGRNSEMIGMTNVFFLLTGAPGNIDIPDKGNTLSSLGGGKHETGRKIATVTCPGHSITGPQPLGANLREMRGEHNLCLNQKRAQNFQLAISLPITIYHYIIMIGLGTVQSHRMTRLN